MREVVDTKKGYVKIANNLFENIFLRDFSNRERALICLVIRLSYGFNHKTAIIKPKSRFSLIGTHRQDINTVLNGLISKKVIISYGDNVYALNKHFEEWDVKLNKFFNKENFNDLKSLQFSENVSTGLTDNVSPTLTSSENIYGSDLQNSNNCKSQTYSNVSPTLTKNDNLSVPDLQEQAAKPDVDNNRDLPKDIIKDNINTSIKDIYIGNEDKKPTIKYDPYFNNPIADLFRNEYKKLYKKNDCYLDNFKLNKLLEIGITYPEFKERLPEILKKFSQITFTGGKKPTLKWLIIDGNWTGILNGEYDQYIETNEIDTQNDETNETLKYFLTPTDDFTKNEDK